MELVRVEPQWVAIVRRQTRWDTLMDAIHSAMAVDVVPARAHQRGHNVFVYWPGPDGQVTLGVGFQVGEPFDPIGAPPDQIVCERIPGGEAGRVVHVGPYAELKRAWDPLLADLRAAGLPTSGVQWELYGDHHDDPAHLRTEVFVLVRPDP